MVKECRRGIAAKVMRLNPENPLAPVQSLRRNESLFTALEWEWKEGSAEAYIFPDYSDADTAAKQHGGFPVVIEKAAPPPDFVAQSHSRSPEDAAEDLDKRHLW